MSRQVVPALGTTWTRLAACRGLPVSWWFRERGCDDCSVARSICAGCRVRSECLADALAAEGDVEARWRFGVRGGLTAGERAALVR